MLRTLLLSAVAALALATICNAQSVKPKPPPGRDPGGIAIALISTGIDYRRAEVAARLARDGEGELIGWDTEDHDNRPFDRDNGQAPANWGGNATELVETMGPARVRLVPVRINPADAASLAGAVAFIARTPARIAVLPMWSSNRSGWDLFRQAAEKHSDLLFVAAAGDEANGATTPQRWPAGFRLANVLVVAATVSTSSKAAGTEAWMEMRPDANGRDSRMAALRAAETLVACSADLVATYNGAALKAAVLARAQEQPGSDLPRLALCDAGSRRKG